MFGRRPKSPLANRMGLNFGGRKPKRKRVFIGAALLLIVPYIGSTLAATVTISGTGGTTAIEFGQGSQVAITCDTTITSEINEAWYATSSIFRVDTVVLSGVDVRSATSATSSNQGCGAKNMTLKLFTGSVGSESAAVIGAGPASSVTFAVPTSGTSVTVAGSTNITAVASITDSVGVITLTIPNTVNLDASTVTRISIQTD
jgi:hypothetical protein